MTGNSSFNQAKIAKNDEFYTLYSDVEQELSHYSEHLKGKVILCNCNDGEGSAFWQYFSRNFEALQLAKLIGVKYGEDAHVLEMTRPRQILKTFLDGDGDFRSTESIELLKTADLVITNPPFSLFSEYLAQHFA